MRPPEQHAALNITKRCNQRCTFCFEGTRSGWDEPTLEEVVSRLEMVARKHESVIFMGAEALLRRDITEVIRKGRDLGLRVSAFTNGRVLARPGFVDELAAAGLSSLQVSVHYADADSFARGTGTAARHFEELWHGLEAVAKLNRSNPSRPIAVSPKTVLFALNFGKLQQIIELLRRALAESFQYYMIGSIGPCEAKNGEYLLEPFAARRAELAVLLDCWQEPFSPVFSMVPLCLIPGREHLSYDVRIVAQCISMDSNFTDKSALAEMHDFAENFRTNPLRWQCRECSLLALCPSCRCSWTNPRFAPRRDQTFRPVSDTTVTDVLRRVATEDSISDAAELAVMKERAQAHLYAVEAVDIPELSLVRTLRDLRVAGTRVVEIYCDELPVVSTDASIDGVLTTLHLRHLRTGDEIGFPVRYLNVVLEGAASAKITGLLHRLSMLPLPPVEAWRGQARFDEHWARTLDSVWEALGEVAWPGIGGVGSWRTVRWRMTEDAGLSLALREAGGAEAEVRFYCQIMSARAPSDEGLELAIETEKLRCYWSDASSPTLPEPGKSISELLVALAGRIARRGVRPVVSRTLARRLRDLRGANSDPTRA